MLFFLLINVKTLVGILTFMSRKNFKLSSVKHEKSFITLGLIRDPMSSNCFIEYLNRTDLVKFEEYLLQQTVNCL